MYKDNGIGWRTSDTTNTEDEVTSKKNGLCVIQISIFIMLFDLHKNFSVLFSFVFSSIIMFCVWFH